MNIIVPATSFPRWDDDAAGRFVFDLSKGLSELGHTVTHIVPRSDQGSDSDLTCPSGLTVRTISFGVGNWGKGLAYGAGMGANVKRKPWLGLAVPSMLRAFKRALTLAVTEVEDPLVLSHWAFPAGLVASDVACRQGFPHVGVIHGGGLQALTQSRLTQSWGHRWAKGLDACVFVSEDLKKKAACFLGPRKTKPSLVQPMGIDSSRFAPRSPQAPLVSSAKGLRLLGVGRFIKLKGFDLLIEAASHLEFSQVVLCGQGPEEQRLRNQGARLGVSCIFLGQLTPEALGEQYRLADLLVVPSRLGPQGRSEGSPMVVLEALSQGLPFVGSATGGLQSLAEQSSAGVLFMLNDCHDLLRSIRALAADAPQRMTMKKEGLQFAGDHEYSVVAKRVEELLENVRR